MKLYVCWGTFQVPGARPHPCRIAYEALKEAGHEPELVRVHGAAQLPDITKGRREVKRLSGASWVPLLVTDDGEVVGESQVIAAWAREHPAGSATDQRPGMVSPAMVTPGTPKRLSWLRSSM